MTRSLLRHSSKTHIHKNASFPVGVSELYHFPIISLAGLAISYSARKQIELELQ